jgi:hypothetical protein
MLGWTPKDILTDASKPITASVTNLPVGRTFNLNSAGATEALLVAIKVSGLAGTATFKLQHAVLVDFEDVSGKSVAAANGWNYIKLHSGVAADAALMPLLGIGRVVLTTNGSGAGTIENLVVMQQL